MTPAFRGGAVVYACDIERVGAFYAAVADLGVVSRAPDHVALERDGHRITIVAIPDAIARTITIDDPPARREETALKLSFPVADIAAARAIAAARGGVIDPPEREWEFRGERMCDGHDPEGNVIQVCAVTTT